MLDDDVQPGDESELPSGETAGEEEGFLDSVADGAGDVAKKTSSVAWAMLVTVLKQFYRYLVVIFLPIPIRQVARNQLAYREIRAEDGSGESRFEFYSQPNIVATVHLIWVGWAVAGCQLFNKVVMEDYRLSEQFTRGVIWFWLFVLCVTILVMGIQFGRVASGFLLATVMILVLSTYLLQQVSDVELLATIKKNLHGIELELGWGIPLVISLVLGITMLLNSIWQQLDDRWIVAHKGNFLEHENFQHKDRTIQKGAKTFVHSWPCLIRRWLLFGYGEIEVRDSRGLSEVERIEGIFWARHVSELLKSRFETTDVSVAMSEELEEEEEG